MSENAKYRINDDIVGVKEVRLVSQEGAASVVPLYMARRFAEEAGLDLVEVAGQANPPVCKILDFSKFKYEEEKKEREVAKRQRLANKMHEVKEIRFRPATDENDFNIKVKSIIRFLGEGYRAKATIRFRGREMSHIEFGQEMMEKMISEISEFGTPEDIPRSLGRDMSVIFVPKKRNKVA